MDPPARKRAKAAPGAVIDEAWLVDGKAAALSGDYASRAPFPHAVLDHLCEPAGLAAVRQEMVGELKAKYKESDLFKVYQTMDLGNLRLPEHKAVADRMPMLSKLVAELYSEPFRSFVSGVTGCARLSGTKQDCSANIYMGGGHLLCHDDVIGTRAVSYIVYLTEDDDATNPWTEQHGGALQLYDLREASRKGAPAFDPTVSILPKFNRMAFFAVAPGQSYHQVQEVFGSPDDPGFRPRLSISGWFHWEEGHVPPALADSSASRLHLQEGGGAGDQAPFAPLAPQWPAEEDALPTFTDEERRLLASFVSAEYLEEQCMRQVRDQFCNESSVELRDFLKDGAAEMARLAAACDAERNAAIDAGGWDVRAVCEDTRRAAQNGWDAVGPAHMQHYLRAGGAPAAPAESGEARTAEAMRRVLNELFSSDAFAKLLFGLTTLRPRAVRGECRRFRRGADYTVAYADAMCEDSRLDATLVFLPEGADARGWDSGEVGGFDCYIAADEDSSAAAAAVFQENEDEDDGPLVSVSPMHNSLSLVLRDAQVMRFIKYVSKDAPSSRFDITCEYELPEDAEDDEDAEDAEGEKGGKA